MPRGSIISGQVILAVRVPVEGMYDDMGRMGCRFLMGSLYCLFGLVIHVPETCLR